MFSKIDPLKAYEYTRPHPLNERMRVTDSYKGLGAIKLQGVLGVHWQRTLPEKIHTDFAAIDFKNISGKRDLELPEITSSWTGSVIRRVRESNVDIPFSLNRDVADILGHFRNAIGERKLSLPSFFNLMVCMHNTGDLSRNDLVQYIRPHRDGGNLCRLITCYANMDKEQGTVWYPDCISPATLGELEQNMRNTEDPLWYLQAFDREHNAQRINPGDILMLKGSGDKISLKDSLVHRSAVPQIGTPRVVLMLV